MGERWQVFTGEQLVLPPVEELPADSLRATVVNLRAGEGFLYAHKMEALARWFDEEPTKYPDRSRLYNEVDHEARMCAKVGAALQISPGSAAHLIKRARQLANGLPSILAAVREGRLSVGYAEVVLQRTELVTDVLALRAIDATLDSELSRAGSWSRHRLIAMVDATICRIAPDGVKQRRQDAKNDIGIRVSPLENGLAQVIAMVTAEQARIIKTALSEHGKRRTVEGDTRTHGQREADALVDLVCGTRPAGTDVVPQHPRIVVHVVANQSTVDGDDSAPAVMDGHGVISADHLRDIITAGGALVRPIKDGLAAQPGDLYRPTANLDSFLRARDLFCTWPGCSSPAWQADLDHTVEYDHHNPTLGGRTSADGMKSLCRFHHLVKSHTDWLDDHTPDGLVFTSDDGIDHPGPAFDGTDLFPDLGTYEFTQPPLAGPPPAQRDRRRTRESERLARKRNERKQNRLDRERRKRARDENRQAAHPPKIIEPNDGDIPF